MLFNSFVFIFGFLPVALIAFYATGRWFGAIGGSWLPTSKGFCTRGTRWTRCVRCAGGFHARVSSG